MIRHTLVAAVLTLLAASAPAQDTPYQNGTRALNGQRWAEAVADFGQVAAARGKRADAALYWKAYSLSKLGKPALANATCAQLQSTYSSSSWNNDCSALTLQLQLGKDLPNTAELQHLQQQLSHLNVVVPDLHVDTSVHDTNASDTDLKLLALNSLMQRDPARAIPILRNLLATTQPETVKQHALFVLGQSSAPEAQQLMHDLLIGRVDPSLQIEAIQMTATTGRRSNDTLEEIYRTTSNPQVKEAVTSALFVSGDAPRMVRLAREEKNLNLKRDLVSKLALMQDKAATDYMLELLK